jgi:hypothetical protein
MYENTHWTQGDIPGVAPVWKFVASCFLPNLEPVVVGSCAGVTAWTSSAIFVGGSFTTYSGKKYKASWWT